MKTQIISIRIPIPEYETWKSVPESVKKRILEDIKLYITNLLGDDKKLFAYAKEELEKLLQIIEPNTNFKPLLETPETAIDTVKLIVEREDLPTTIKELLREMLNFLQTLK